MFSVGRLWRTAVLVALAVTVAQLSAGPPPNVPQADDEQLFKTAHIGADGPAILNYFRQRTVSKANRQKIDALIRKLGDPAYAIREQASEDILACGLPAIGPLRDAKNDADVEIARRAERCLGLIERVPSAALSAAAARALARFKPAGSVSVLLAYLPYADDEAVTDEIGEALAAVAVVDGKPDPNLIRGLDDTVPLVRGAAAEALARTGLPAAVESSRKALVDANADVRLRVAVALVTRAKDKAAVPSMIKLLGEVPQGSGWRIEDVMLRLAGDTGPSATLGEDAATRDKCRIAWQEWWDKNGPTIDLTKLDGAPPMLGNTLIVLRDQRGGGKIVEINNEKKELWKIENLQFPSDALVVGRDRVLIAETNAQQISERDFNGKVIWAKQLFLPSAIQRLPNGNTFVVCRNQLVEFDTRRHEVFSVPRQQQDVWGAQKLRGGDTVLVTNTGQCIRLDAKGKEGKSFAITRLQSAAGGGLDVLPNNHVVIALRDMVAEYDGTGAAPVWHASFSRPTSVQRLPNGNTLVASCQAATPMVAELDRAGHAVWEYKTTDGFLPWRARRR